MFNLPEKTNSMKKVLWMSILLIGVLFGQIGQASAAPIDEVNAADAKYKIEDYTIPSFTQFLVAKEAARLNRELKDSQKERKKLERELKRKEKALAEAAALLVLSKKANAIWGDPEDEK
jgi:septal ring factor EnvC (AmiA/AmiB activator)